MKPFVRWAAVLGIVTSAWIGPSLAGKMSALALPEQQVLEKLKGVPVFTITDAQGSPLIASVTGKDKKPASVAGVFISPKDAQDFIVKLKSENPQLGSSVRVWTASLGEVYKMSQNTKGKPQELQFAYVPTSKEVESAKTVLQQTGKKPNEFNGVPLFLARGGPDNGYLTIQQGQEQAVPMFFNKEDLQAMLERFKQQQPKIASSIKIEVVNLEGVLEALRTDNDPFLTKILLIPSRESMEYVKSQQPPQAQPKP